MTYLEALKAAHEDSERYPYDLDVEEEREDLLDSAAPEIIAALELLRDLGDLDCPFLGCTDCPACRARLVLRALDAKVVE